MRFRPRCLTSILEFLICKQLLLFSSNILQTSCIMINLTGISFSYILFITKYANIFAFERLRWNWEHRCLLREWYAANYYKYIYVCKIYVQQNVNLGSFNVFSVSIVNRRNVAFATKKSKYWLRNNILRGWFKIAVTVSSSWTS